MNTMVQLLAPYIDHESHSAQHYRQTTDGQTDRQTDRRDAYANSRSYCVAVRSAKNLTNTHNECEQSNTVRCQLSL